jgi:hypothetical protein
VIAYNNVHHAIGDGAPGLWCDISCNNTTWKYNSVHDNPGEGLLYEISCYGTIQHNTIINNGWDSSINFGWYWHAGIVISSSHNVDISENMLFGNYNGLTSVSQKRISAGDVGSCGNNIVTDITVNNNSITLAPGSHLATGLVSEGYTIFSGHNTWNNNHYYLGASNYSWFDNDLFGWNNAYTNQAGWQRIGQDVSGTFGP